MTPPPPSSPRVEEILRRVHGLAPEELRRALDELCAGDVGLREQVQSLLKAANTQTIDLLQQAEAILGGGSGPRTLGGAVFGPFTILRLLGEGGMGRVYEARQDNPDRVVALKVIQQGMIGPHVLRRFQHEAQILAGLKHPGIAQVYQAGAVPGPPGPDGESHPQPYFAMELVRGPTLTAFANDRSLTAPQRLMLVARLCDAIEHAHQRGVIHRDLKPGNILVEESGGDSTGADDAGDATRMPASVAALPAQPKVLDFGIARLVDPVGGDGPSAAATMATQTGQVLGTVAYMSPEQVRGDNSAIDARSDVYAIGVIGYELLAGRLPIEVRDKPITEAARLICDMEPPRLGAVNPALRGDIETIIAKAMAKEPEQRYPSAGQMALDIRRSLRDEPIMARPASAVYHFRKFARRNRGLVGAGSLAILVLIAGTVVSTVLYIRSERARQAADRESRVAQAVRDYLVRDMISATLPYRLGREAKVVDVLESAAKRAPVRFADQPEIEAEVSISLAQSLTHLGRAAESETLARRAVELADRLGGPDSERSLRASSTLIFSMLIGSAERKAAALPFLRESYARARRALPPSHPTRLEICSNLAVLLQELGHLDESLALIEEARSTAAPAIAADSVLRLKLRHAELTALLASDRQKEAIPVLREILTANAQKLDSDPAILTLANNLVNALTGEKAYDEAVVIAEKLPAAADAMYPEGHLVRGFARGTAASALAFVKRREEAEPLWIESYRVIASAIGEFDWNTERNIKAIREFYRGWRKPDLLHPWQIRSLRVRLMVAPDGDGDKLPGVFEEMASEAAKAREDEQRGPERLIADIVRERETLAPAGYDRRARFMGNLARVLTRAGNADDRALALPIAEAAVASLDGCVDAEATNKVVALAMMEAAEHAGDQAKAAEWRTRVNTLTAPAPKP